MDHVDLVLDRNFDNFVASKICTDWSVLTASSNNISLIGFLSVHAESVFITENSYGVEGKLVSGTENSCSDNVRRSLRWRVRATS
jgi:hypothetical protein